MRRQSRQGQALRALPAVAALTASPSHADRKLAKAIGRQPTAHASGGAFALGLLWSFSRYKEDVFEEVAYEAPTMILDKLPKAELGVEFFNRETREKDLERFKSVIVRELLELRGMIG